MKKIKEILINIMIVLLVATTTNTYSRFIKSVEKNGTINGKIITASDLSYTTENGTTKSVQQVLDEITSMVGE